MEITKREKDFAQWYQDIIEAGDLAEHAIVKGCMVIKPHGYALWEYVQNNLDKAFKEVGVQNAYFPLFIPESLINKEKAHVEGFAPELAVVTHGGGKKLEEPLVVRPTSETIMYATFAKWIHSWRDLPLLINQWANVVRWEKRTRLFLRTTEFLWQEGHTVHATSEEADTFARQMLSIYKKFVEEHLAIPVIDGQKPDSERFAGAQTTYTIEAIMQDGKAVQSGTSHMLGDNFAKAFEIMYSDESGDRKYGWQTSWGVSTRIIGSLIMTHSDDKGLVLPPKVAPIKVVIIPIYKDEEKEEVLKKAYEIKDSLTSLGRIIVDEHEGKSPGSAFYEWERKGVPIRIEIGPKDLQKKQIVLKARDSEEKQMVSWKNVSQSVETELNAMQDRLWKAAQKRLKDLCVEDASYDSFNEIFDSGKYIKTWWCGDQGCQDKVKEETKATIRCIPFEKPKKKSGNCAICGDKATHWTVFARAY